MHDLTVTAIGADRPGIVARVTGVLFELDCNLADCAMNLLGGQFAIIMLVETPDGVSADQLSTALSDATGDLGLTISVGEVAHTERVAPSRPYVLSLYGTDHPGIVHEAASVLAGLGVNITDLLSRAGGDLYTIVMDLDLPDGLQEGALLDSLAEAAQRLQVDFTLRPADAPEL